MPIGSDYSGWGLEVHGVIRKSHSRAEVLGAYVDAILDGASDYDASDIAKVIETRPRPSY